MLIIQPISKFSYLLQIYVPLLLVVFLFRNFMEATARAISLLSNMLILISLVCGILQRLHWFYSTGWLNFLIESLTKKTSFSFSLYTCNYKTVLKNTSCIKITLILVDCLGSFFSSGVVEG